VNLKLYFHTLIIGLPLAATLEAQTPDLTAVYQREDESIAQLLFTNNGTGFSMSEAFLASEADLNEGYPHLTVSADFTGDGLDEIAHLDDLQYTPNMVPAFVRSLVWMSRAQGDHFQPSGSWLTIPDSSLSFGHVDFSVAGDYNQDGFSDIALFYNDHGSDQLHIYVLQSNGSGFSDPLVWYTCDRSDFNFTALKFACAGDFNGNGKPDIAVYYNYFGTAPETRQSVFLFESEGSSFSLLPRAYDATKESYDFTNMEYAIPGDYNLDGLSDMAVLHEDPLDQDLIITVFEGSIDGQLSPVDYNSFLDMEPSLTQVHHAVGGNFSGDSATDLALFYDNPGTGKQEILELESELSTFKAPEIAFSAESGGLSMADISEVRSGRFSYEPIVSVATWKDDRQGAISFTFDDGYRGAFEHGGAELEAAGLKGTFYILTDTTAEYYGELASTALVMEYKNKDHEIASHTSNHSNLGWLTESGDVDSINQLLSASIELLNERFNQYTMSMSIPYGSFLYETLELISSYFFSARSSQFGFNLATPYDFFALKSWPVLSTNSPAFVDSLLLITESFSTYLPLMYHDMVDTTFDEELHIYTYSRQLFSETLEAAQGRDLWIDTHERIYKYIRERNALRILDMGDGEMDQEGGKFSFIADDGLPDSIFNVELSLKINLPQSWIEDTVTVGPESNFSYKKVQLDGMDPFIRYDWLPVSGVSIQVHDGIVYATGSFDRKNSVADVSINAAPNPFRQETLIRVTGADYNDTYLIVRDIHGRIVQELRDNTGDSFKLSRKTLMPGIYVVQLVREGRSLASIKLMAL
jgi:peptidoglycan/xylan/chitin deacetylase (PgdA/CDA1 family)